MFHLSATVLASLLVVLLLLVAVVAFLAACSQRLAMERLVLAVTGMVALGAGAAWDVGASLAGSGAGAGAGVGAEAGAGAGAWVVVGWGADGAWGAASLGATMAAVT